MYQWAASCSAVQCSLCMWKQGQRLLGCSCSTFFFLLSVSFLFSLLICLFVLPESSLSCCCCCYCCFSLFSTSLFLFGLLYSALFAKKKKEELTIPPQKSIGKKKKTCWMNGISNQAFAGSQKIHSFNPIKWAAGKKTKQNKMKHVKQSIKWLFSRVTWQQLSERFSPTNYPFIVRCAELRKKTRAYLGNPSHVCNPFSSRYMEFILASVYDTRRSA